MTGWVCERCGDAHGRHPCRAEELVLADCGLCGQRALCASSTDFGGIDLSDGSLKQDDHGDV